MTDFTPRLLSEADAAADLAGLPRPTEADQALPRPVSSEDVLALANKLAMMCDVDYDNVTRPATIMLRTLVSERDAIAARMAELESEVLDQCRLNGMGAERELALMGRVAELEAERGKFVNLYLQLTDAMDYDSGKGGIEFSPEEWAEALLRDARNWRAALSTTPESKP